MDFCRTPQGAKLKNLEWTDLGVRGSRLMGDESTIAQVHPKECLGFVSVKAICKPKSEVSQKSLL